MTVPIFYQCVEPLNSTLDSKHGGIVAHKLKARKNTTVYRALGHFKNNPNESNNAAFRMRHYLIDLLHDAGTVAYNDGIAKDCHGQN